MNFGKGGDKSRQMNKQWVHPPEALLRGHIVYNVKFLGHCEVDTPKGTEVVKDAIRKMKFSKQIKKAEGQKPPKVELTISVDGVTVQDPKTKIIQYQYPLHRISYCADDKSDKRMLTFIAKESESQQHHCYVFDSDKCAEEITLSIGQAFDLAYRKFLESSSRDMDMKKQLLLLQKKVHQLTSENLTLKARIADLERSKEVQDLQQNNLMVSHSAPPLPLSPAPTGPPPFSQNVTQGSPVQPEVGRKLENLLLEDNFGGPAPGAPFANGTATPNSQPRPLLQPPPASARMRTGSAPASPAQPATQSNTPGGVDVFGATPFVNNTGAPASDPFGMGAFNPSNAQSPQELDRQIQRVDRELLDIQAGFSQGLSFGTEDFSLADFDPLNQN